MKIKVIINSEECKGCGLCVTACPKKILEISKNSINSKGYFTARIIDQDKCITCAFCRTICPDVAITVIKEDSING